MSLFDLAYAIARAHVDFDVAFFGQRGARGRFDGKIDAAEDGRVGGGVVVGCGTVGAGERVEGEGDGHFVRTGEAVKGRAKAKVVYAHMVEDVRLHGGTSRI